jgi:hypothetical protein
MRLLVENVVGFEGSCTRARMMEVMQAAGYAVQVSAVQTTHHDPHSFSLINHVSSPRVNMSQASYEHALSHQACNFPMCQCPKSVPQYI